MNKTFLLNAVALVVLFSSCSTGGKDIESLVTIYEDGNLKNLVSLVNNKAELSYKTYKNNSNDSAELNFTVNLVLNFEVQELKEMTLEEADEKITAIATSIVFYDKDFEKLGYGIKFDLDRPELLRFYEFLKKQKGTTDSFSFTYRNKADEDDKIAETIKSINYFMPEVIAGNLSWEIWGDIARTAQEKGISGEQILTLYTQIYEGILNPTNVDPDNFTAITNRADILLNLSKELNEELIKYPETLSPEQMKKYKEIESKYTKLMQERVSSFQDKLNEKD